LSIGIVPGEFRAAVAGALADDIRAKTNHLDTGVVGSLHLLRALTEAGHDDEALALAQQTSYPSWGYMLKAPRAPGTFWENWENKDWSKNHPFLGGGLASWLLESVAGIRPIQPGYAEIEFKPCLAAVKNLTTASGSMPTARGEAAIRWSRKDSSITLDVTVPANSRARIFVAVPGSDAVKSAIREGDSVVWQGNAFKKGVAGIISAAAGNGYVIMETGSGHYHFTAYPHQIKGF
jgi:alpha-L-rhamnosidase